MEDVHCRLCLFLLVMGCIDCYVVIIFFPQGSGKLEAIQIIKKLGGRLCDSYLEEGEWQRSNLLCAVVVVVYRVFFVVFRWLWWSRVPAGEEDRREPTQAT